MCFGIDGHIGYIATETSRPNSGIPTSQSFLNQNFLQLKQPNINSKNSVTGPNQKETFGLETLSIAPGAIKK
jgi:hypothetical protein